MTSLRDTTQLLTVCLLISAPGAQSFEESVTGVLPDGYIPHPDVGFAYKVYSGFYYFTDWTGAESFCVEEGGHLAVIDSEKKLEYALYRPNNTRISQYRHVGIHKVNGHWVSIVDGSVLSFIPWATDEPDFQAHKSHGMIDVVSEGRKIVARSSSYREDFVCQIPIFATGTLSSNETSTDVTQAPSLPDGYVAYPDIGLAYKVHADAYRNWTKSKEACVLEGGHLAVIDSEKKLEYALRPPIEQILGKRHVGIRRVNRQWVSVVDGRVLTSIPWAKDEPFSRYNYNCAMVAYAPKKRRIMSVKCSSYGDFVCEIPLPATV